METKETGIIMSGNHPRLILDGLKTMTRRTGGLKEINKEPDKWILVQREQMVGIPSDTFVFHCKETRSDGEPLRVYIKPRYQVGSKLWVKERHFIDKSAELREDGIYYYADEGQRKDIEEEGEKWRPSIFMPRWASRILLEITEVRAEKLNCMTESDAHKEGVDNLVTFKFLWDRLNKKRGYEWKQNCWVWVLEFHLV